MQYVALIMLHYEIISEEFRNPLCCAEMLTLCSNKYFRACRSVRTIKVYPKCSASTFLTTITKANSSFS
jgi:hypothetical protein